MLAGNIPGRTQTMPMAIFSAVEDGDMRLAMLWVGLIVVISLAIIRLLNWESRKRKPRRKQVKPVQVFSVPEAVGETKPEVPAGAALEVSVERHLENFDLKVDLQATKGAVGLLGASGAGKSMTLRMIAGIVTPDRGRIVLNGRVLFDRATGQNLPAAQRRVGVVFQDYALFPNLTVAENVGFGLSKLAGAERAWRVAAQLQRMQIAELAERYPSEISGGQRQRTAIARCLAIEPDALLFDEPFAALDPHLRRQMEEQLRETLADYSGAVLFVTHDMEEAFRFCTDLLVIDRGRVIASGPKQQLFECPQTVVAARLTGCKNIVAARRIGERRIAVDAWNCELQTARPVPEGLTHLGMRSHQVKFGHELRGENTFPCWLVSTSEAPHEMTLYLRLHTPPQAGAKPHLQADVPKDLWRTLSDQPQPWNIQFPPERLLLLEDATL
jgi:molybdate transport system permease protein